MTTRLENEYINVYNEDNILIGGVKVESNFKVVKINIKNQIFELNTDRWITKVLKDGVAILHLKRDRFWGNTTIVETDQKITGVRGAKWGTQLIDNRKNTQLKIRNDDAFSSNNKYVLEITDNDVSNLDIILTLFGHIQASNIKNNAIMIPAILFGAFIGCIFGYII